jgi:hypothetical protein
MLLRLKLLPKLPAATRGICFAKMAVAACSLGDPCVRLEIAPYSKIERHYTAKAKTRYQDITSLGSRTEFGVVILHAYLCHLLLWNMILIRVLVPVILG